MGGIYIHYPFCIQKCEYCDFYSEGIGKGTSSLDRDLFSAYRKELRQRKGTKNLSIDSIFIGGGTPSKANSDLWGELLQFVRGEFNVTQDCEVTLEMNPEDLGTENLELLSKLGVNRLSVGVQSTKSSALEFLGRYYDEEKYQNILEILQRSPIKNQSIDLMYGIPSLSLEDFWTDLEKFASSNLNHMSVYALTLEKGTSYSRKVSSNQKPAPKEEEQLEVLKKLPSVLTKHGFVWYEVSNYSRNQISRHNMKYWTFAPYLGIGPGAHSFWEGERLAAPRSTNAYLRNPGLGKKESISPFLEICLGLFRLLLPFEPLGFFCAYTIPEDFVLSVFERWASKGLCHWDGQTFQWKETAILILDDLILELASQEKALP